MVKLELTRGATNVEHMVEKNHLGEGIFLKNPRSKVTNEELSKLRYLCKIPQSVEVRALEAHERIDWVVPSWVALYEMMFMDGMRLPIPRLVRDGCAHYEITPIQLMPNAWRILLALESLSV